MNGALYERKRMCQRSRSASWPVGFRLLKLGLSTSERQHLIVCRTLVFGDYRLCHVVINFQIPMTRLGPGMNIPVLLPWSDLVSASFYPPTHVSSSQVRLVMLGGKQGRTNACEECHLFLLINWYTHIFQQFLHRTQSDIIAVTWFINSENTLFWDPFGLSQSYRLFGNARTVYASWRVNWSVMNSLPFNLPLIQSTIHTKTLIIQSRETINNVYELMKTEAEIDEVTSQKFCWRTANLREWSSNGIFRRRSLRRTINEEQH